MKKKSYIACLCTLALTLFTTSCEENSDDPKYRSLPPVFADMEFKNVGGETDILKAGDKILATCVQQQYGRLLDLTSYKWKVDTIKTNKPVSAQHNYKKEVVYDLNAAHPTDTIIFKYPGTYYVTFDAKYNISGQAESVSNITSIEHGSIRYSNSPLSYFVTIEKRISVK